MNSEKFKSDLDDLWADFRFHGISLPLNFIDQITYLIFVRLLDQKEVSDENEFAQTGKKFRRRFNNNEQHIRWQNLRLLDDPDELFSVIKLELFPYIRQLSAGEKSDKRRVLTGLLKNAALVISDPYLLKKTVVLVDKLPLNIENEAGEIYYHLFGKLNTGGIKSQFRTPRSVNELIVKLLDPQPSHKVIDPSCGTGGLLVEVIKYLRDRPISDYEKTPVYGNTKSEEITTYKTERLPPNQEHWVEYEMLHGCDVNISMLRFAAMNVILQGISDRGLSYTNTLSDNYIEYDKYDIVLCHPPFHGNLEVGQISPNLITSIKTKQITSLFLLLTLRLLKRGGRAAVIVPDRMLSSRTNSNVQLRREIIYNHGLEAVISLPQDVFQPYTRGQNAVLIFTKGGKTDNVFFYDLETDTAAPSLGFRPDPNRIVIDPKSLSDCVDAWKTRDPKHDTNPAEDAFFISAEQILNTNFELSPNRYKEYIHKEIDYGSPSERLAQMKKINADIEENIEVLANMLK